MDERNLKTGELDDDELENVAGGIGSFGAGANHGVSTGLNHGTSTGLNHGTSTGLNRGINNNTLNDMNK